jgi:glycine dehydrogenase subunit 1
MSYISLSDKEKKDMLDTIGIDSVEELFQAIPEGVKLGRPLKVPEALSEPELVARFEALAAENRYTDYLSFLGGGVYPHFIPAVVDYLAARGEFVSPYTPYQPEVSQGTLQVIFEFQTLMCQLTGMDIANASLYDGASGAAEAVLMANRLNRRTKILVASSLHPQYRQTIDTYIRNLEGISAETLGYTSEGRLDLWDLEKHLDEDVTAVIFQSPNYFGVVEDIRAVSGLMHDHQALSIAVVTEAVSLGLLEPPGASGVDIVTGEAQSFGIPLSFGGPLLGFMACSRKLIRQLPGRIAGETKDVDGNPGFVLTLSTREQHIRRERATSNICTNQALCLLRTTIYLESLGRTGLRDLAELNLQKAAYARNTLTAIDGVRARFTGPVFNEFALEFDRPWREIEPRLRQGMILGGLDLAGDYPELANCALVCVTETHAKEDIDRLTSSLKEALS